MKALAAMSLSDAKMGIIASSDSMELIRTVATRCATEPEKSTPSMLQASSDILARIVDAEIAALSPARVLDSGNVKKIITVRGSRKPLHWPTRRR